MAAGVSRSPRRWHGQEAKGGWPARSDARPAAPVGHRHTVSPGAGVGRVLTLSPRTEGWPSHVPGAVLAALVAPEVLAAGPAGVVAALATVLVAVRTGNTLAAMATGVAAVLLPRTVG